MQLAEFNAAPPQVASRTLLTCADVPRWVEEIVAARPYATVAAVVEACRTAAEPWTDDEIDSALARHPRIGERAAGGGAEASLSRREQAGVGDAPRELHDALAAGNRAYEDRFGHVFLIRAAGRTAHEILQELDRRLTNDPATERAEVAANLREIAALRVEGMLTA